MPPFWIDLLFLHGHITDVRLARRLAGMPPEKPRPRACKTKTVNGMAERVTASWRLCLGIGDGAVRAQ
jgi:hypothetical protein